MRVVVTGSEGRLGQVVVARLRAARMDVARVDRRIADPLDEMAREVDLRDLGQVYGALVGADAVVHLRAIPWPVGRPPEVVYANNVVGQFNVCEAAATLGIPRIVSASSVSALGFPFQHRRSEPLYLPIDEEHPLMPQDAYGLSKANGEEIVAAYCRRGAGSAASLRFPTILNEALYRDFIDDVRANPGGSARYLWSYIDARDAADACLLALTASFDGRQPLYVAADDTTSDLPTDTLLERYYPAVQRRWPTAADAAYRSLLDTGRATEILGFRPCYSWRSPAGVSG